MEESNKKIEAAEKSGDTERTSGRGARRPWHAARRGQHVDPIDIDQLKPFVPDTFAGLPKKSSNAEKNGVAGLMVSKAEADLRRRRRSA